MIENPAYTCFCIAPDLAMAAAEVFLVASQNSRAASSKSDFCYGVATGLQPTQLRTTTTLYCTLYLSRAHNENRAVIVVIAFKEGNRTQTRKTNPIKCKSYGKRRRENQNLVLKGLAEEAMMTMTGIRTDSRFALLTFHHRISF